MHVNGVGKRSQQSKDILMYVSGRQGVRPHRGGVYVCVCVCVCCVVCSLEHAEAQGGGEVCLWKVVRGRKGTGGWEAVCLSVILCLFRGKALRSVTMSERVSVHVCPSMWGGGDTQEP